MFKVYNCVVHQHDLRLVALAVVICALSAVTAINLLHHVRKSTGAVRNVWLCVAATACGFGIWATHFIAMLAFSPGINSGYDIVLTLISLVAAIALTGAGFAVAVSSSVFAAPWLGGAIVGCGIAAMHYCGMAAFAIAGRVIWDTTLVAGSLVLGVLFGTVSLPVGLREDSRKWKALGALLLTAAICSLHFTAMSAVAIIPDMTVVVPASAVPNGWIAAGVAFASSAILLLACAGLALDLREQRHRERESDRMRGLANAAVEGLIVCDDDNVIAANDSFARLIGRESADLAGVKLAGCFPQESARRRLLSKPKEAVETLLRSASNAEIPVELILQPVDFGGKRLHAIAVRDLRDRKQTEQHIRFLAHHDGLTGLPNRSFFNRTLDQAITLLAGTGKRLAVLCLDLDRFKEVNDLFGHSAGDTLLQSVAKTVTGLLSPGQMMARLGGDEFAIIMPELPDPTAAGRLAEAIIEALRTESEHSATAVPASCSIGIALFPDDAIDRNGLLTHADAALYKAKAEGRCGYRFFETALGDQVRERRQLEHDLRQAISRHELRLVYQPQTRIASGDIIGFEALLRWRHPTRGDVPPATFIPIAEESGSVLQIGEWALRTACREAASWSQPLNIAVNVSAVQIHHARFAQLVHEVLIQTGLSAERLELEIIETALVRDLHRALQTLRQLKALGVRIAMDDFGTGYSSLSNLRSFPFDKIKIDRSFVKAVDSSEEAATIVRAVLGLGRGLGLPVLAEGVETAGELGFLGAELCQEAQGYLVGKPAGIEQFRALTHPEDGATEVADQRGADRRQTTTVASAA